MSRARVPLTLEPDQCDRCRQCTEACPTGALKIGPTYIYVDWRACDGCLVCAKACSTGAITPRAVVSAGASATGARATGTRAPGARVPRGNAPVRPTAPPARLAASKPRAAGPFEWTLAEAWIVMAALLAAFVAKDVVLASEAVRALDSDTAVFARVGALFSFYALQACVLAVLAWRRDAPLLDAFGLRGEAMSWGSRVAAVGLVVALLIGTRLMALVYGLTAQSVGWEPPAREVADLTEVFGPTVWGLVLSVALVVVVAPLIEEIVFRGVLQGALAQRVGHRIAIVAAAALFAASHMTAWLLVPLFVLGLVCGWLAHTRSSLLPAIWLHAAYNVLPVAVAFYLVW